MPAHELMAGEFMIRIRTASVKDVPEVLKLIKLGAEEGALLPRERKILNALSRRGDIMAAFDGHALVGVAILDFYSRRLSELRSLYVLREYRNARIGKMLVERLVRRARTLGVKELMTITFRERKGWFTKQGFGESAHGFKVALFKEL